MSVEGIFDLLRAVPNPAVTAITSIAAKAWSFGALDVKSDNFSSDIAVFLLAENSTFPRATIRLPKIWEDLFKIMPYSLASSVVHSCSRAVDHFNNRYIGEAMNSYGRAGAYEAEYLLTLSSEVGALNRSQSLSVQTYPEGIRTANIRHLIYSPSADIPLMSLV